MTTLVLTDRKPQRRNGFFRPLVDLFNGIRLARAMAHRYDVLSRLSDVELAERNIAREDIPRLVVNGKYDRRGPARPSSPAASPGMGAAKSRFPGSKPRGAHDRATHC